LALTMPIALAVVFVLAIVVLSESRVIRAYPNGGGSYLVARENHGVIAGLVAASALLIDYVLTVAVSTAAGVAAISSFMPELHSQRVEIGVGLIALLAIANLRGVREAGVLFAAPTYAYMAAMFALIAYGRGRRDALLSLRSALDRRNPPPRCEHRLHRLPTPRLCARERPVHAAAFRRRRLAPRLQHGDRLSRGACWRDPHCLRRQREQ